MDRVLLRLCDSFAFFVAKYLDRKGCKVCRKVRKEHPIWLTADSSSCSIMRAPMKSKKTARPHPMPVDALVYPRFSGVPTFMRLPHIPRAEDLDLGLIGIPFDGGTTYRPGARFGPRNIRVQSAMIRPWNPVLKVNPFEKWRIGDFGDLSINPLSIEDTYQRITEQLGGVLRAGARPVCVGGDHSILLPILRAIHKHFDPWDRSE